MKLKFFTGCAPLILLIVSTASHATDYLSSDGKPRRLQYESKKENITHASEYIRKSNKKKERKLLNIQIKTDDAQPFSTKH